MKRRSPAWLLLAALLSQGPLHAAAAAAAERGDATPARYWTSRDELYRLSFESQVEPIPINRLHRWTLRLESRDGRPVTGARIDVAGGMPEHDHGLPTSPRVTRELDDGAYLLEGVRFHMNGAWQLIVSISAADGSDTVVIDLDV